MENDLPYVDKSEAQLPVSSTWPIADGIQFTNDEDEMPSTSAGIYYATIRSDDSCSWSRGRWVPRSTWNRFI